MNRSDGPPLPATGLGPRTAFVVHVHAESLDASAEARGRVEHVPTGRSDVFTGMDGLRAFMRLALGRDEEDEKVRDAARARDFPGEVPGSSDT